MDERKDKGLIVSDRLHPRTGSSAAAPGARSGLQPVVAQPSAAAWRRYCECRLRQFAGGR
jgi:hypothetical protein